MKKPKQKKWYQSTVIWFNALCAGLFTLEASLDLFKPLVGEKFYPILAGTLAVGNAALRVFVTKQPIKGTPKDEPNN